jgi:hypothetical protein
MGHAERFDIDNLASVSVEDTPPEVKEGRLDANDVDLVRRYLALNRLIKADRPLSEIALNKG